MFVWQLFRPVNIDDTGLLPVRDVDRLKLEPPNLHALVIDVIGEVGYKLAVTSVVLKVVFSRHHFKHSPIWMYVKDNAQINIVNGRETISVAIISV